MVAVRVMSGSVPSTLESETRSMRVSYELVPVEKSAYENSEEDPHWEGVET